MEGIEKRAQLLIDMDFDEINKEMMQDGRNLRRKLNTVSVVLIIFLAISVYHFYF